MKMKTINEKEIKTFVSKVDSLLPVHSNRERVFIKNLRMSIDDYCNSTPDVSIQDVINNFGEPLEIVRSYIDTMDVDVLIKEISARRILKRIFATVLICAILGVSIFAGFTYKAYQEYKRTIITESETVIDNY